MYEIGTKNKLHGLIKFILMIFELRGGPLKTYRHEMVPSNRTHLELLKPHAEGISVQIGS